MELLEELKSIGVDVDEGINRCMGNVSLYKRMMVKFSDLINKTSINTDFDDSNYLDAAEVAHTIKGSAGNLSITPIYEAYAKIVNLLRAGRLEEAKKIIKNTRSIELKIIDCMERHSR